MNDLCQLENTLPKKNEGSQTILKPEATIIETKKKLKRKEEKSIKKEFRTDISEVVLKEYYLEKLYSCSKIGKLFGVCRHTIVKKIKMFNIPLRKRNEEGFIFHKKHELLKLEDPLSISQIDVINGSLLGDGSLYKRSPKNPGNSFFRKSQTPSRLEYLEWTNNILGIYSKNIKEVYSKSKIIHVSDKIVSKPCERFLSSYELTSISHPIFSELEKKWYKRNPNGEYDYQILGKNTKTRIKIIPSDLELTPLTVAIWFCDDGWHSKSKKTAQFCTHSFSVSEVNFLISLFNRINLHPKLKIIKHKYPVINFNGSEYIKLMKCISPYIIWKCFNYKMYEF